MIWLLVEVTIVMDAIFPLIQINAIIFQPEPSVRGLFSKPLYAHTLAMHSTTHTSTILAVDTVFDRGESEEIA